jgi:phenylpyruvate tautomerase PptA (4-oxalocrotonate tautomerase family)
METYMPILTVKVSAKTSKDFTAQIGTLLLDLTSRILKKKAGGDGDRD